MFGGFGIGREIIDGFSMYGRFGNLGGYELLGERVNVDSFAVMVRSVAQKLFDLDSSIIEQMAASKEAFPTWTSPVFAYDQTALRNPVKLTKDTDIYISTGYSAYDCICFIRALLKKYDLDLEDDFVYSARPNSSKENSLDRIEVAKKWCETQKNNQLIGYDSKNSQGSKTWKRTICFDGCSSSNMPLFELFF